MARAWTRLVDDTQRAFPSPAQRQAARDPAYWVTETGREVANVGLLQGKVQRRLSAGPRVLQQRDTAAGMHEARTPGWEERLDLFEAAQASECSKGFRAIPWIDDGDLHVGNTELLVATALRFGLDLPAQAVPRRHCPCCERPHEKLLSYMTIYYIYMTYSKSSKFSRHIYVIFGGFFTLPSQHGWIPV
jgi:hypothetical protein